MGPDRRNPAARRRGKPSAALRSILVVHRYLGVAVGLLMTLWCVSGFVMMYQAYPSLTEAERLAGLAPLDFSRCCAPSALDDAVSGPAPGFRIEMLGGDPVLRLGGRTVDLATGEPVRELTAAETLVVARELGRGLGIEGDPRSLGIVDIDQWTVQTAARNRPVHHFAFDDAAGTEIYVSGATGEVFQDTNRRERVLTWLGAIPHWLYPLELRQNGPLWLEVVIWTSVVGTFLAATGLYVGISRLIAARRRGRLSLFRGWWYWHHVTGLVFGVLALTWVFSGLLTVNPWGLLSGGDGGGYARDLRGDASTSELRRLIASLPDADVLAAGNFVQLESAPFDGQLHVIGTRADGSRVRLDSNGRPAPLSRDDVAAALAKLPVPVDALVLMTDEDPFYYGHKGDVDLPVHRAILDDADRTRVYVNPTTGDVRAVDATRRLSRWIRTGLHDFDFAGVRIRPVWDVVVGLLLIGVTLVCATGTWMGLKRIALDARRVRRRLRRWLEPSTPRLDPAGDARRP